MKGGGERVDGMLVPMLHISQDGNQQPELFNLLLLCACLLLAYVRVYANGQLNARIDLHRRS